MSLTLTRASGCRTPFSSLKKSRPFACTDWQTEAGSGAAVLRKNVQLIAPLIERATRTWSNGTSFAARSSVPPHLNFSSVVAFGRSAVSASLAFTLTFPWRPSNVTRLALSQPSWVSPVFEDVPGFPVFCGSGGRRKNVHDIAPLSARFSLTRS